MQSEYGVAFQVREGELISAADPMRSLARVCEHMARLACREANLPPERLLITDSHRLDLGGGRYELCFDLRERDGGDPQQLARDLFTKSRDLLPERLMVLLG